MDVDDPPTQSAPDLTAERSVELELVTYFSAVNFFLLSIIYLWQFLVLMFFFFCYCRIEAFNSLFGQHMRSNRLEVISIDDIENAVNTRADVSYSRAEITSLLEASFFNIYIPIYS